MRLALLASTLVVCLALAAPARAEVTGSPELLELVDRMMVPVVSDQVIITAPCPADPTAAGCTSMADVAPIYLHPNFAGDWFTLYHELGHRFDHVAMTARAHLKFAGLVGARTRRWGPRMIERFADAYADCARNATRLTEDDSAPRSALSPRTHRRVCALIESVGIRAGLA